MAKIDLKSPGSIPNHTLKKNLKANGNAIEYNTSGGGSESDILKTHAFVVAKKNDTGQVKFNPNEYQGGIEFNGETTFTKAGKQGHALKIGAGSNNYTGGRVSVSGSASAINEQVNGILDFVSSPATAQENHRSLGGYIRNVTDGYGNTNTSTPVTAGGVIGISHNSSSGYVGAVKYKFTVAAEDAWSTGTQTLTQTSTSGSGTGAEFIVDSNGVNLNITVKMNRHDLFIKVRNNRSLFHLAKCT